MNTQWFRRGVVLIGSFVDGCWGWCCISLLCRWLLFVVSMLFLAVCSFVAVKIKTMVRLTNVRKLVLRTQRILLFLLYRWLYTIVRYVRTWNNRKPFSMSILDRLISNMNLYIRTETKQIDCSSKKYRKLTTFVFVTRNTIQSQVRATY